LSGRQFEAPKGHQTHPMSERVRAALFNMLGDLEGLSVLDAYAGSGALGLEALSRGAKSVQFIDNYQPAHSQIVKNLASLGLAPAAKTTLAGVESWSQRQSQTKFDLILADPPYERLNLSTISLLAAHLTHKGLMVLSYPGRESAPTVNGVVVVDNRNYGDAALAFYRLDLPAQKVGA